MLDLAYGCFPDNFVILNFCHRSKELGILSAGYGSFGWADGEAMGLEALRCNQGMGWAKSEVVSGPLAHQNCILL